MQVNACHVIMGQVTVPIVQFKNVLIVSQNISTSILVYVLAVRLTVNALLVRVLINVIHVPLINLIEIVRGQMFLGLAFPVKIYLSFANNVLALSPAQNA
jgi:hypothetical protein